VFGKVDIGQRFSREG